MDELVLDVYRRRASQLAAAMKLCADGMTEYSSAVALLAVHSAISYNDVLLILLTGKRSSSQDHQQAVRFTAQACRKAKLEFKGIRSLETLLKAKTDVSYGDRTVDQDRAYMLSIAAERFQAWVEGNLRTAKVIR